VVTGKKFYLTGAMLAHHVSTVALDDQGRARYAIVERGAEGQQVIEDWSSFDQRTTLSRKVTLDRLKVRKTYLVPGYKDYDKPMAEETI
jgi:alkylation response protein AidB-like acyl-CoA dehydrogenase